jgi:hypothetical protein
MADDDPAMVHGYQRILFIRIAAGSMLALALAGGADAQLVDCLGGQRPTQVAELMFGRNIGSRIGVSEGDFGRFVDREIMSRFPNGLTVFNAAGQWRDEASNKIAREPSKVVQIVLPGQVDDIARLNEIVETYKRRFKIGGHDRAAGLRVVLVPAACRAESALATACALAGRFLITSITPKTAGSARHGAGEVRRP